MTDAHRRAAVAERAARAGGAVARQAFRDDVSVSTKSDRTDLVTDADHDAQRQVVASIAEEFPSDTVLAEEEAVAPAGIDNDRVPEFVDRIPATGDCWVVDPIDGTTNFSRGVEPWATAVAAVVDGEPVAAATYLPVDGDAYTADRDGATRDGTPLSVSDRTDPEVFLVAPVGWILHDDHGPFGDAVERAMDRFGDIRVVGSMHTTLAYVASGGLDATFVTTRVMPWDTVGGVHLVRQAGGTVTDVDGEPWTHESDTIVASNGQAHDLVREVAATAIE